MRWPALLLLMTWLVGCAAPLGVAPDPREQDIAASPEVVLREAVDLLMAHGYVIRHADAELGRAEAVLARWPGYRVRLQVDPEAGGSRVSLTATRGARPLPAELLDPLLKALQARLDAV